MVCFLFPSATANKHCLSFGCKLQLPSQVSLHCVSMSPSVPSEARRLKYLFFCLPFSNKRIFRNYFDMFFYCKKMILFGFSQPGLFVESIEDGQMQNFNRLCDTCKCLDTCRLKQIYKYIYFVKGLFRRKSDSRVMEYLSKT